MSKLKWAAVLALTLGALGGCVAYDDGYYHGGAYDGYGPARYQGGYYGWNSWESNRGWDGDRRDWQRDAERRHAQERRREAERRDEMRDRQDDRQRREVRERREEHRREAERHRREHSWDGERQQRDGGRRQRDVNPHRVERDDGQWTYRIPKQDR